MKNYFKLYVFALWKYGNKKLEKKKVNEENRFLFNIQHVNVTTKPHNPFTKYCIIHTIITAQIYVFMVA